MYDNCLTTCLPIFLETLSGVYTTKLRNAAKHGLSTVHDSQSWHTKKGSFFVDEVMRLATGHRTLDIIRVAHLQVLS